jgi:hypothetical protein
MEGLFEISDQSAAGESGSFQASPDGESIGNAREMRERKREIRPT